MLTLVLLKTTLFQYQLEKCMDTLHFCKLFPLPTLRSRHNNFVGVGTASLLPTLKYHHKGRNEESSDLRSKSR